MIFVAGRQCNESVYFVEIHRPSGDGVFRRNIPGKVDSKKILPYFRDNPFLEEIRLDFNS